MVEGGALGKLSMLTGVGGALPERGRENPEEITQHENHCCETTHLNPPIKSGLEGGATIGWEAVSEGVLSHSNTWGRQGKKLTENQPTQVRLTV